MDKKKVLSLTPKMEVAEKSGQTNPVTMRVGGVMGDEFIESLIQEGFDARKAGAFKKPSRLKKFLLGLVKPFTDAAYSVGRGLRNLVRAVCMGVIVIMFVSGLIFWYGAYLVYNHHVDATLYLLHNEEIKMLFNSDRAEQPLAEPKKKKEK